MGLPDPSAEDARGHRGGGPCDLCCRLPGIHWPEHPELHKPPDVPCRNLVPGKGCRVHADRPMHCASFQCLWIMGFGREEMRPDLVGGYFTASDSGRLVLMTDSTRPDPRTIPAVEAFVRDWLVRRRASLVVHRAGREVGERRHDGRG